MNNFNKVFVLVRKHCQDKETILKDEDLQKIAIELNLTVERLYFYLECIRELGLIRYCGKEKNISLTDAGMESDAVFC